MYLAWPLLVAWPGAIADAARRQQQAAADAHDSTPGSTEVQLLLAAGAGPGQGTQWQWGLELASPI